MKITLVEEAELKKQNERAKAENYSLSLYLHPGVKLQNEMVQANMEKKQNQNELPVLMDQVKVKVKVDTKTETPKVQNINEVYYNFDIAKREAKRRARWDQSKTGRLVNALADITVKLIFIS